LPESMLVTDFHARRMAPQAAAPDGGRGNIGALRSVMDGRRGVSRSSARQLENRNERGDYPDTLLA
jgi:hypothetical protein